MVKNSKSQKIVPIIAIVVIILAIMAGVWVATRPLDEPVVKCEAKGAEHVVLMRDNVVLPARVDAARCDVLKIVNSEPTERTVMFGEIDDMEPYSGIVEQQLLGGESFSVTLYTTGEFAFHNHASSLAGRFTVHE